MRLLINTGQKQLFKQKLLKITIARIGLERLRIRMKMRMLLKEVKIMLRLRSLRERMLDRQIEI